MSESKIVGYQGTGSGRPIYEIIFNGQIQRVAITTESNGAHILTGDGQWAPRYEWQEAITAYQNGSATNAQKTLLENRHWLAP